ncbi:MAG TPA: carbohydrate-binding family 9-like protein [Terriglobales bacterium]|nr:carbohydrate-binding family 9-like protein [Terriglobales bacterium]
MSKAYAEWFQWDIRILRSNHFSGTMLGTVRQIHNLPAIVILASSVMMSQTAPKSQCKAAAEAVATHIGHPLALNAAHPDPEWKQAQPISFCSDWQGKNPDPARATTVRLLWNAQTLYLRFECRYREIFIFDDSDPNGRRDHLWERDVAEMFLQEDPSQPHDYKEFEISPNGMWIDLDISRNGLADLKSGLQRSVSLDKASKLWAAELAIPLKSLSSKFDPAREWRVNFFRVEGSQEPRNYFAWRPTHSPQPNFHVPEAFGVLRFSGQP